MASDRDLALLSERSTFRTSRWGDRYDMGEVDGFLDRLVEAVRSGDDVGPVLAAARFSLVLLRPAYAVEDVHRLLDTVARAAGVASPFPGGSPPATGSVIEERPGLLRRLLGR